MGVRFLFVLVVLGFSLNAWAAGDMILTLDDGREVILHEDNTWGFAKFTVSHGDEEDIYITVDDGRTVWLKMEDNTWEFTTKKAPQKKSFQELPTVTATASSTKPVLDQAVQTATQDAFKRAADRLVPYAKKSKLTHKYLIACIKNEIGEAGAEVSYKPGWTAQAKVSLEKVQVKKILDCVETQIDLATPETQDSTKAAKK
ncbi:MAG TPA: DUF3157 family protein [Chitinispirillaceae bacterium]|jgi:hypothetical protein|nr:DUF3157 family protein [Chitinispirillaceae bacterium]